MVVSSASKGAGAGTGGGPDRRTAVVVGAGVSGCVAALALAAEGVRVALVNGSLDSVGLPGYGPIVDYPLPWSAEYPQGGGPSTRSRGLAAALRVLAPPVAGEWSGHGWELPGQEPPALVDRRSVSLAVKWMIENQELIELRQGIVTGIEDERRGSRGAASLPSGGDFTVGPMVVRTAFGERIAGDAVILAVGLALGGRIRLGDRESLGGRLGEVGSDALLESLKAGGARFERMSRAVGPRVSVPGPAVAEPIDPSFVSSAGLRRLEFEPCVVGKDGSRSAAVEGRTGFVPPPSPYDGRWVEVVVYARAQVSDGGPVTAEDIVAAPDGVATGEWYISPGAGRDQPLERLLGPAAAISRPAHEITGYVAAEGEGRLLDGAWITGQGAGARGYAESLGSGWRVGRQVAAWLGSGSS